MAYTKREAWKLIIASNEPKFVENSLHAACKRRNDRSSVKHAAKALFKRGRCRTGADNLNRNSEFFCFELVFSFFIIYWKLTKYNPNSK